MREEFKKLIVDKEISIREAIKIMDETARKILFVVDHENRLAGTISDGDIRRWVLKDGDLSKSASNIYNTTPKFFYEDYNIEDVKELMLESRVEWIPILGTNENIVDILLWEEIFGHSYVKNKAELKIPAVIMAGGKGTRLDPFTRILPKPLIPIGDKPIIEIIMDHFNAFSINEFYITLNYKGDMIRSYFDNAKTSYSLNYIWESNPLGTAGGLKLLPDFNAEDIFLSNCDIIIKSEYDNIYNFHKVNNFDITIVASMQHFKIPYGVLTIKNEGELQDIREKPEYNFLINTGMYVLKKEVIQKIPDGKAFDMTDLIDIIKGSNGRVGVYPINQKSWIDIGQWEEYQNVLNSINK